MLNLYITDLKKIIKDKLFLVTCILGIVFTLMTPVLYKALFEVLGVGEILGDLIDAKTLTFSAFSTSGNLGFIMPILIAIIVCKDFSQGTVRNKIISGKSRAQIYLSHLLSSATVICILMLLHAVLTLLFSLCFFSYQSTAFTAKDFGYLMASFGLEMIVYFAISAIVTFIATSSKNIGSCIILYLAVSFVASIIGSVLMVAVAFVEPESTGYYVMEFINSINIFSSTSIGLGTSYTLKQLIYALAGPVIFGVGSTFMGILIFAKKDLK